MEHVKRILQRIKMFLSSPKVAAVCTVAASTAIGFAAGSEYEKRKASKEVI